MMLGRDDFHGVWKLQREIDDRHGGQQGEFLGTADLRAIGDNRLQYRETGVITLGAGPALNADRAYQWIFRPGLVEVRFADGGAFHSFTPEGQSVGTDHPCGDDDYRVAYDFSIWPAWTATWTVQGPRKNYTSKSRYHR